MALTPGTRLGVYEVTAAIGEGGMGEVYRATDTTLGRQVAIKILPDAFASDPERLARFEREAKTLASLNHPHIAAIYGFEKSGGLRALVMELVEGDDLSQRIARGAIPIDEALAIAKQVAEALEAAHEQGIVHRDLKPANIKIKPDGTVKVLDFGLAKAIDPARGSGIDVTSSPTFVAHGTQIGVIMGTAAYMAPEQARGKAVDRRADIWAFGIIGFEMLTGRRAFAGDELSDVLAAVLRQDIDWSALPPATPLRFRRLIERCLDRDARQRLRDIGEARVEIAKIEAGAGDSSPAISAGALPPKPSGLRLWWLALPMTAVVAALMSWTLKPQTPTTAAHLSIALPAGEQVTTPAAISLDGKTIAYAAGRTRETSRLYLRAIDSFAVRGVESSRGAEWPFFSPDGGSIAFFASGKLWRASVRGGAATALAATPRAWGGTWGSDGSIVYVPNLNAGLWRVPENGGTPVQLTKPDGAAKGYAHAHPQFVPGTDDLLFAFWGQTFYTALFSPKTATWREATPAKSASTRTSSFVYTSNGYLLVGDGSAGMTAIEWTPATTSPQNPQTVVESVYWINGNERPFFNASGNGTVVYSPGNPNRRRLVWVDRTGHIAPLAGDADQIDEVWVSRGGTKIVRHGKLSQWVEDLNAGTQTRIVSDLLTWSGGWLPGDDRVVVSSNKDGDWDLFTVSTNGTGEMKPLLKKPFTQHPMAVAPDGSVIYIESHPVTGSDLWVLTPDGRTRPLVVTPFNESSAAVSSDGRYVAYQSDESGRHEVYAIPFSGTGDRVTISRDGGTGPAWSRDGRELFYRAGDDLMSVEVRSTSPLVLGARKKLLDVSAFEPGYFHDFDVSADGQRFLFIRAEPDARPARIDVILNWFPELARLVNK